MLLYRISDPVGMAFRRRGYTLVEMIVAMVVLLLVVAAATAGWVFVLRGERLNAVQTELDMDVHKAMERLRAELRLSAADKVFFSPAGPGPYTAISFPLARDDDRDGVVELGPDGTNIVWDQTVIYHVWTGTPYKLLRTVFDPRDNTLTDAQRQSQVDYVAAHGTGAGTYNGANARTYTVFENLFTWALWAKSAVYDAYAPTLQRDVNVALGSVFLSGGSHNFTFTVVGTNSASSGYKIGLDTLVVSPCGVEREAEAQLPVAAQYGAAAAADYRPEGSWSGNYQLLFPATATGHYFTLSMANDRWEETNFRGEGALCNKTVVEFDQTLTPKDFVVRLEGPGDAWTAEQQSGNTNAVSAADNALSNSAVRVLLRGRQQMENGGMIGLSGKAHYVMFTASDLAPLHIKGAFIAEAASHTSYTANAAATGTRLYFYSYLPPFGYTREEVTIPAGGSWWASTQSPFAIEAEKSYVVSFLAGTNANAMCWPETRLGAPGAYVIPGSAGPNINDARDADWSGKPFTVAAWIPAVSRVYTQCPTNGTFTSQIFDTKIAAPAFSTMSWNVEQPSGTALRMKVRSGSNADLSDAPAWSNVTAMTTPGSINPGNYRYVQFQAILDPNESGAVSPKLRDVTIAWAGESKAVDIGTTVTQGPDYGVWELRVDGKTLIKGLRVDLTIFKDVVGWGRQSKRLTSSLTMEVEPRNTGK